MPPTYSSPGTPTGTGAPRASSTYALVLATGRPMGGRPPPGTHAAVADQMVASVGPYRLKKRRSGAQRSTSSAGHASPAVISVRNAGSSAGGSTASAEGGRVATVTSSSWRRRRRSGPGARVSRVPSTSVAPAASAITISNTEASKLGEANWSTRSPASTPRSRACPRATLASPRCGTSTPLGRPVEPEV
jgi:hypothetical protein